MAGAAEPAPTSVNAYLSRIPEPARSTLKKLRVDIRAALPPGNSETISYGIPAFKGKRVLLWYAVFRDHCSLFPTAAVIAALRDDLKGYTVSKGTIHFPIDKPLPSGLIKKIVRMRLAAEKRPKRD